MGKYRDEQENILRSAAWIGDAVLSLYLRQLLLVNRIEPAAVRAELFKHFSSNQFLNNFGRPTAMEAEIGDIYEEGGLGEAFRFIEEKYLPVIRKQLRNREFGTQLVIIEAGLIEVQISSPGPADGGA